MKAVGDESFLAKYSFILPSAALAASIIDWDWVFDLSLQSFKGFQPTNKAEIFRDSSIES
jgi:hypothetical protein